MAKKKVIPQIVKDIRGKIKRDIDWTSEKLISFSQFSMYSECPKKWSLQYKEGQKQFTSTVHTVFGTAIHEVIQHYLTTFYEQSGVAAGKINTSEMFEDTLREEYAKQYKSNNKQHFSNPTELREFYDDGIEIIRDFAKNKSKYFSKRGWYLVGVEIPITLNPHPQYPNVVYQAYLDIVLYHEPTNTIKIIDLKTSTYSWGTKQKTDKNKTSQLILYKKFFSEIFSFPIEKIQIEFMILKRKIPTESDFHIKRIQTFTPPSGKTSINQVINKLNEFISTSFNENGFTPIEHSHQLNDNCKWCPYFQSKLCPANQ
jgi:hypothetical protein